MNQMLSGKFDSLTHPFYVLIRVRQLKLISVYNRIPPVEQLQYLLAEAEARYFLPTRRVAYSRYCPRFFYSARPEIKIAASTMALNIARQEGLKKMEAGILHQLGICHSACSEYKLARDHLKAAMVAASDYEDKKWGRELFRKSIIGYASVSMYLGNAAAGLQLLEREQDLFLADNSTLDLAEYHLARGSCLAQMNRKEEALESLRKVFIMPNITPDHEKAALSVIAQLNPKEWGMWQIWVQQTQRERRVQEVLHEKDLVVRPSNEIFRMRCEAERLLIMGKVHAAYDLLEEALKQHQILLAQSKLDAYKIGLMNDGWVLTRQLQEVALLKIYHDKLDILSATDKLKEIIEVGERGRARALEERLRINNAKRQEKKPQHSNDGGPQTIQDFLGLAKAHKATIVTYSLFGADSVLAAIFCEEELLLCSSFQLQGVSEKTLFTLPRRLGARTGRNFEAEDDESVHTLQSQTEQTDILQHLYAQLIAPMKEHLPPSADGEHNLIIIPDRWLFLVPWAALLDEKSVPLIQRYTLRVVPSMRVLHLLAELHTQVSPPPQFSSTAR